MLDYETLAVSRLTGQFQDSPKLKAIVEAIVSGFTEIENTLDAMKAERWVNTAIGKQLDGAGYIVGVDRKGRDDESYRTAVRCRSLVSESRRTRLDLLRGMKFLTPPDDD